jgi:hypothetical protein
VNKLVIAASLAVFVGAGREAIAEQHVDAGGADGTRAAESTAGTTGVPAKAFVLGVEKGVVIPIGNSGDFSGFGLGVPGRLEYLLSPRFAVTFNPGLLFRLSFLPEFHGGGGANSTSELLLAGGMRYMVTPDLSFHALTGLKLRTLWADTRQTGARGVLIVGGRYKLSRVWSIGANLLVSNLLFVEARERVNRGIVLTVGHDFM